MAATTQITIVDYGVGNVKSITNMVKKAGGTVTVSSSPDTVGRADKIILPGVGAFDVAMTNLRKDGLDEAMLQAASRGAYILGICLGMQVLGFSSEEGALPGLGLVAAHTVRFPPDQGLKIPHMGWNDVHPVKAGGLFPKYKTDPKFYFVHSYHVVCHDPADVLAVAEYGQTFTAALQHGTVMAAQFHPEKSHMFGLRLLQNFIEMT
jgi:imidazole glycerol-phosphate synthase subunit HisH